MLKKFSDYFEMREQGEPDMGMGGGAVGAPSAPALPSPPPSDTGSEDDDASNGPLLAALKVAVSKFRPQVEKFVNHLAAQDEEIKAALSGADASSDSEDHDDVAPAPADSVA